MLFVSACAASAFTNEVQAQDAQNLPIGQSAHKKQIDRLEILQTELQQSQQAHQQAIQQQPQNPELIHRHEQDINALNREIERANKEKVIDVTWTKNKSTTNLGTYLITLERKKLNNEIHQTTNHQNRHPSNNSNGVITHQ